MEFSDPEVVISSIKSAADQDFNDIDRVTWIESHFNQIARAIKEFR